MTAMRKQGGHARLPCRLMQGDTNPTFQVNER